MAKLKPASCGVHDTIGGRPCVHCPQVIAQLRLESTVKFTKRAYVPPATRSPGATPANLLAKKRRAY